MKKIAFVSLLILLSTQGFSQKGILFFKGTLKSAFALAKTQNKPLFVEIYAIGCPHCENFKKTFDSNTKVGAFYNQRFISYQLEVNSPEARAFRQKHNIYVLSTPLMTFWDKDENLLHIQSAGDEQNNEAYINNMAERALNPQMQSASWKNYFKQGMNDDNFLIEYAYNCRLLCDTTDNIAAMNIYAQKQQADQLGSVTNFVVLQKVVMDDENPLFKYMINHLDEYNAKYGKANVKTVAENIIMYSLYSSRGQKFPLEKYAEMRANLQKIGIDEQSILGRFVWIESAVLFKNGQDKQASNMINTFCKGIKNIDKKDAAYIETFVKTKTSNPEVLQELDWIFKKKL
ncbi:thioredoxin family protein [Flectobacillus major]|uniref:thioredoxin family protein n=1 Tax=Flectobacillus major TaxID=103 RepID=UPI0003FB99BC|nr:thioredoxin family protein [Flectobacillus major]